MTTTEESTRWAIFDSEIFGEGWTPFPKAVQFDESLSRHARFLYSLILAYAYKDPYAFPGRDRLCLHMGCNQDYLSQYLAELEDVWIKTRRRGQGKTNLYIFLTSRGSVVQDFTTLMNSSLHDSSEGNNKEGNNSSFRARPAEKSEWTVADWVGWTVSVCESLDFSPTSQNKRTWGNEFKSRLNRGQSIEHLERLVQKGVARGATWGYPWSLKKAEEKLGLTQKQATEEDDVRYLN